jgi:prepilin-type N-terminal cleavage/methylation domain-containing protein
MRNMAGMKRATENPDRRGGFTLVELVIVVGVMGVIGALAMASFGASRRARDVLTSGQNVLSVLATAQARAAAGEGGIEWGVRLEQGRAILFGGMSYGSSASTTIYAMPSGVQISNIALAGGGQEIVFRRLDGMTDQSGTFEIQATGSVSQAFPITVDASGRSYRTGSAPPVSGTRVVDARHRNFALGWSIKNATTMRLTFSDPPGPDMPYDVAMSPASPRTSFDWSGTVAVGGRDQALRIHALSITDSDTTLSVDRDCGYNDKKVVISIDAKTIATYEADCATVTVGAFGGAMSEP